MRSLRSRGSPSQLCPETPVIDDFSCAASAVISTEACWAALAAIFSALVLHFSQEAASAVRQSQVTIVSQAVRALRYLFMRSEFIPPNPTQISLSGKNSS